MNLKFVIVLLAFVAASQAMYFVVNTWADEYCNTTLIGKYWVSKSSIIKASISNTTFSHCRQIMRGIALRNASSLKTPEIADLLQFLATEFIIRMTLVIAPPMLNLRFRRTGMLSNWEHCNYQANDSFYGVVAGKRN